MVSLRELNQVSDPTTLLPNMTQTSLESLLFQCEVLQGEVSLVFMEDQRRGLTQTLQGSVSEIYPQPWSSFYLLGVTRRVGKMSSSSRSFSLLTLPQFWNILAQLPRRLLLLHMGGSFKRRESGQASEWGV